MGFSGAAKGAHQDGLEAAQAGKENWGPRLLIHAAGVKFSLRPTTEGEAWALRIVASKENPALPS